jgi:cytochrome c peroxidase
MCAAAFNPRAWGRAAIILAVVGSVWSAAAAGADPSGTADLSAQDLQHIESMGPWPPIVRRDPGNRVSGRPLAIELGRQLFRDPRMSPVGYIACVTCHQPDRAFGDATARAHALAKLPRNTPALANLAGLTWYGWGGASDSLWMASIRPILNPGEFDGSAASVVRLFEREPDLAACYRRVFGVSATQHPPRTLVNVGKALAAFIETLVTERTPFDDLRDALARGSPVPDIGAAAWRGLRLFVGRGDCVSCHAGPALSDGRFHRDPASAEARSRGAHARVGTLQNISLDTGRLEDAAGLKASVHNLLGPDNDDGTRRNAAATRNLSLSTRLIGQFRTPSLRNVVATAPYLHDGRFEHLRDAVRHRASPALSDGDADDLVAFLATLSDRHGARRPWQSAYDTPCR